MFLIAEVCTPSETFCDEFFLHFLLYSVHHRDRLYRPALVEWIKSIYVKLRNEDIFSSKVSEESYPRLLVTDPDMRTKKTEGVINMIIIINIFKTILHKNTKCCWPRLFILNSSHHIFIQLWWRGKKWVHVKNVDFYAVHHENMQLYQLKLETIINLQVILTHSDLNQKCTFSAVFLITAQNILRNQDINNQLHMPQQQSLFIRHAKLRNKQF